MNVPQYEMLGIKPVRQQTNAPLARCNQPTKILARHWAFRKTLSRKFPLGVGANVFLAVSLISLVPSY